MLLITPNTSERTNIRNLLLINGFREQWLNESAPSEYLYFNIDWRGKSFSTIKHDDFDRQFQYDMLCDRADIMSSMVFRTRFAALKDN